MKKIHNDLRDVFGGCACSLGAVYFWIDKFSLEKNYVQDDPHSGHPFEAVTESNIDWVHGIIEGEPYSTVDEN